MRKYAYILAALLIGSPAAAEWKEYAYVAEGFAVAFPAEPQYDEIANFEAAPGKVVPAHSYSVRFNNGLFKITVADGRDANLPEDQTVQQAIRRMSAGGQIKIDFPHRIYRIYGRQMSIAKPDNSITTAAVFFANDRLYQIESTRFPGGSDTDLLQFQQSLTFDRNVANRTKAQMDAIRAEIGRAHV